MSFQICIDHLGGGPPSTAIPEVVKGQLLFIDGWIADGQLGAVADSLQCVVDDSFLARVETVGRPDVAAHFGRDALLNCGFQIGIRTDALVEGKHRLALSFADRSGRQYSGGPFEFQIGQENPGMLKRPRMLIAAAPKSGSTFTRLVLERYFETGEAGHAGFNFESEQNLDSMTMDRIRGHAYVLQMHIRPYESNISAIKTENMSLAVSWRNIGDAIVSLDDHVRKEGLGPSYLAYMDDATYLALEQQQRFGFLIRYVAPWYVNFFFGWRARQVPFFHYELLAENAREYYSQLIKCLDGHVDQERLDKVLASSGTFGNDRRNVGRVGRSAEFFSDDTKDLLESVLRSHVYDVSDLIAEYPWNKQAKVAAR